MKNRYYFLPFKMKMRVGEAGVHVMVIDARGATILDVWNEGVAELTEVPALNTAAQMLGYRNYEHIKGGEYERNPPTIIELEFRKFDKSPTKYISSLGMDPAQFPGLSNLKNQLTYTENEAENVYNEGDAAALIVKKVARRLGV